ncbi:MAG: hypothetical protein R6V02_11155 [Candidatus Aminicenantes bacterium]
MPEQKVEKQRTYCRKLGHFIKFGYCLQCGQENLPCSRVFDCWHRIFPVEAYIRSHYSKEEIQKIMAPPPPRMTAILDMVARIQRS